MAKNPRLEAGRRLQLVIAAADDLHTTLLPLRAQRARRNVKLAASLGGVTSVVTSGALIAANIGFWASIGVALGLGSIPLLVAAGSASLRLGARAKSDDMERLERQLALTYACFSEMAAADGRVSSEERTLLEAALLSHPLSEEQRQRITSRPTEEVLASALEVDELTRRHVLQGSWMLAEADGVASSEEQCFALLAQKLELEPHQRDLKREARALQGQMNDLVTEMFRCCQQVLSPELGQADANTFLEALAQIAATPQARRSLRNSLTTGFSAGGVIQALGRPAHASKLVAQAGNAALAVYAEQDARRDAERRLFELADSSPLGKRGAEVIHADVKELFSDFLDGEEEA